ISPKPPACQRGEKNSTPTLSKDEMDPQDTACPTHSSWSAAPPRPPPRQLRFQPSSCTPVHAFPAPDALQRYAERSVAANLPMRRKGASSPEMSTSQVSGVLGESRRIESST